VATLARKTRLHRRTVERRVEAMESRGWLAVERGAGPGGTNRYARADGPGHMAVGQPLYDLDRSVPGLDVEEGVPGDPLEPAHQVACTCWRSRLRGRHAALC
jgi:hypothetical protein